MLSARQFQQNEIECHLKSGRFKTYMAVWSVFFTIIVAMTLYSNGRTIFQGFDSQRQSAKLTARSR
jgi:uncharacterized protein (DUF2062 family)